MMKARALTARVLAPATAACALLCAPALAQGETAHPLPSSDYTSVHVCRQPRPHHESCLAERLVPLTSAASAHRHPIAVRRAPVLAEPSPATGDFGLRPIDIHHAYLLPLKAPELTGGGRETVAVVDAYNDPAVEADLKVYDETFKLPPCTRANGCLTVVNESGGSELPFPKSTQELSEARATAPRLASNAEGWDVEISLDVETVHGTCQNCKILLVVAKAEESRELFEAEETAENAQPVAITNSWGGPEEQKEKQEDEEAPFKEPGTVITASAGDEGYLGWAQAPYEECRFGDEVFEATGEGSFKTCEAKLDEGPLFPASSPGVVAVGGTQLTLNPAGGWQTESVWNGIGATGSGCSLFFNAPKWQSEVAGWSGVGCNNKRAVADVAAVAAPASGAAVYDTNGECEEVRVGWCTIGGTSLSSPIVAAAFALAGGARGTEYPARTLYEALAADPASLHDVTSGSNGVCTHLTECSAEASEQGESESCERAGICSARSGYDGPTGVGTPYGLGALRRGSSTGESEAEQSERSAGGFAVQRAEEEQVAAELESEQGRRTVSKRLTISSLALTPRAIAAFASHARRTRGVDFRLRSSTSGRIRVRLYHRVRRHGRSVWRPTRAARVITVRAGLSSWTLVTRERLGRGHYLLKLAPLVPGTGRSLPFTVA